MKYYYSIFLRCILIFLPISVFYFIFSPLTIYPVYYILSIIKQVTLLGNTLFINSYNIEIINACIAGSAYYLLYILILFTKDIKFKTRILMFLLGSLSILVMNILRILILIFVLIKFGTNYFESIHIIFWKLVSGVYVAFVWIFLVLMFKIKSIPIYSDLKELYNKSLFKK
ncbi:MAG: pacearchaeosortase [Candidatus Nanoarchaeia archaeon]